MSRSNDDKHAQLRARRQIRRKAKKMKTRREHRDTAKRRRMLEGAE